MKISIVIPIYNASRYLEDCIRSIIGQSHTEWELILVDDGSTDTSVEICDKYAREDSRITVYHRKNQGVSASRNFGTEKSSCEYILFVDGDDYLPNNSLETLCSPLKTGEKYDFIIGNYEIIGSETFCSPLLMDEGCYQNESIKENYANGKWFLMPWNKLINKQFLISHSLLFNTQFALHEDYIWSFMVANEAQSMYVKNGITYYYRINESSAMSNTSVEKDLLAYIEAFNALQKYVVQNGNQYNRLDYLMIEGKKNGVLYSLLDLGLLDIYRKYYPALHESCYISPIKAYKHQVISLAELVRDLHYCLPSICGRAYKRLFYILYYRIRGKKIKGAIWK